MPVPQTWADLSITPANNSPPGSEAVGPLANDYFQAAFAFLKQLYTQGGLATQALNANSQKITNVANGVALTDAINLGQLNTTLGAPSGTRVVFQQAAAPVGWTVDASATFTDCAMRFNQGAGNGGTTNWSSWNYGGTFNVASVALTVAQMPAHAHNDAGHGTPLSDGGHGHGVGDGGHSHGYAGYVAQNQFSYSGGGGLAGIGTPYTGGTNTNASGSNISVQSSGSNISIGTSYANIQNTGGGAGHGHSFVTPQVKFADCVVGIKS